MKFKILNANESRWNGPFIICVIAVGITIVIAVSAIPGVASAIFSPSPNTKTASIIDDLLTEHETVAKVGRDRFIGRSPFFVPKRPPSRPRSRPVTSQPDREPEPPKDIPPQGPPSSYTGPKPTSLLGANVFFRTSDTWIEVGEEKNGVTVIQVKDPWTVTLGHKGGEYDVSLWGDRVDTFFTIKYDGSSRSNGIVKRENMQSSQPSPPRSSTQDPARGGEPRSDYNQTIPIPGALSDQKIRSMSRKQVSDALKGIMAATRRTDLDEETQNRLQHELQELRSRLRTAS